MNATARPIDGMSYEQAYAELVASVERLESGGLSLEDSLNLYERGQQLAAYCERLLDQAELHVRELNLVVTGEEAG